MDENRSSSALKQDLPGLLLAILIGGISYGIMLVAKSPVADPLLIAIIMGILVRAVMGSSKTLLPGILIAPKIFIPVGVIFYAAKNLNFVKFVKVETSMIVLLIVIILVFYGVVLLLGKLLRQKKEITYLIATGSAICGASAIAIMSPVVEAESDDVSISLLAVAVAAISGLFIIFPFIATSSGLSGYMYALLSGSVLQFTGFVEAVVVSFPPLRSELSVDKMMSIAISVKAVRYLGLLIAIPLFASLIRKRVYLPWYLWAFLLSGIVGSVIYAYYKPFYNEVLIPSIKPIYGVAWSISMGALGLNANIEELLRNNGPKAVGMAFVGFFAAGIIFFIGLRIIQLF
jgi:uncharacterized integral membrane protein (TIGR00698 family)